MASIVFAVIALVTSFLAVKCISVMEDNLPAKQKIGYLAGIFWALAGIGIGTAASYFAFHVSIMIKSLLYQCVSVVFNSKLYFINILR